MSLHREIKVLSITLIFSFHFSILYGYDCQSAKDYFREAMAIEEEDLPDLLKKEELYSHAIELCPSYAEAHNNLGDIYEKQGKFEEAIKEYQKAIELKPNFSSPYFGLGDIFLKTKRYREAIQWYEKGLKYDPEDTLTKERMAFLNQMKEEKIIKAHTIKGILHGTRGLGDLVSLSFGEDLIPFDFNKYEIREDAKPQLNEIGKALKEIFSVSPEISIEIAGHTDIRGTDEYNFELSWKRASSVFHYLTKHFNLPREKIFIRGYGKRVTLCKENTEACHALNRRVAIIRKNIYGGERARGLDFSKRKEKIEDKKLILDLGFFYQKEGDKVVKILQEDTRLRSKSDKYFIFLKPSQDCFAYVLQEDSQGKTHLLFPIRKNGLSEIKKDQEYWIPSFGKAFILDEVVGVEKLYLLVTSWPLTKEIEELPLENHFKKVIGTLQHRAIKVTKSSNPEEILQEEEFYSQPSRIESLLERIEGDGGWVKIIKFFHE